MRLRGEKGASKLSTFVWLLVLFGIGYAAWNVGPVYYANYALHDKMVEVARLSRGLNPDDKILKLLMDEVRERGLFEYIKPQHFRITTMEHARKITCEYEREVKILPGWTRMFHFKNEVEQPLVF